MIVREQKKSLFKYPPGTLIENHSGTTLMLVIRGYYHSEIFPAYKVLTFEREQKDKNHFILESYWTDYLEGRVWSIVK